MGDAHLGRVVYLAADGDHGENALQWRLVWTGDVVKCLKDVIARSVAEDLGEDADDAIDGSVGTIVPEHTKGDVHSRFSIHQGIKANPIIDIISPTDIEDQ